jgi:hypothetical protein
MMSQLLPEINSSALQAGVEASSASHLPLPDFLPKPGKETPTMARTFFESYEGDGTRYWEASLEFSSKSYIIFHRQTAGRLITI